MTMHMLHRVLPLAALLFVAAQPATAFDARQQAEANAKTIAPYLDDGTVAVIRFDLTRLNVQEAFKAIGTLFSLPPEVQRRAQMLIEQKYVKPLRAENVTEVYAVLSLNELPRGGLFLVVPTGKGGEDRRVAELFSRSESKREPLTFETCTRLGDAVVCGSSRTVERLKSHRASPRKYLTDAFEAVQDSPVQYVFVPSPDHRRVIAELMPELPEEVGGMTGRVLSQAVQWAAVGIVFTPTLKAKMIVQAANPDAAKKLKMTVLSLEKLPALLSENHETPRKKDDSSRPESSAVSLENVVQKFLQIPPLLKPTVNGSRLMLSFDADSKQGRQIITLFAFAGRQAKRAAKRTQSRNNLKQLGIAMHNFHDTYKGFPPHASYDNNGKPLLSWRVYLLPFLDEIKLYEQFHLDEPWNSEHNKKLIAQMPKAFADPFGKVNKPGHTRYVAPLGPKYIFTGRPTGIRIADIPDGTSNTIMIVEAAPEKAVVWTKPDDLELDAKDPVAGLVVKKGPGFDALLADGSVRFIPKNIAQTTLRALFTRNGGEAIDLP